MGISDAIFVLLRLRVPFEKVQLELELSDNLVVEE